MSIYKINCSHYFWYGFAKFLLLLYKKIKLNIGKTKSFQVNPKNEKDLTVEILDHHGNKNREDLPERIDIEKIQKNNKLHQNNENENLSMQRKEEENKKNPEFDHERNTCYFYLNKLCFHKNKIIFFYLITFVVNTLYFTQYLLSLFI